MVRSTSNWEESQVSTVAPRVSATKPICVCQSRKVRFFSASTKRKIPSTPPTVNTPRKTAARMVVRFQGRFTGAWSILGVLIFSLEGSWGAGVLDSAMEVAFPVEI